LIPRKKNEMRRSIYIYIHCHKMRLPFFDER